MNGRLPGHLALIAAIWLLASPAIAIVLGQFDNFQSGTTQGWTGGSSPTNQPNGGPDGYGDRYLQLSSGGGQLGAFNDTQWSGDYAAAGVTRVDFDLSNFGPDPVSLRVMITTPGCAGPPLTCTAWTSTNATVLAGGIGWVKVEFSLAEPDLTRVLGSNSYAGSIANVAKLNLRHDNGAPDPPGTASSVNAVLGIDNITALPEPPALAGLLAAIAFLAALPSLARSSVPKGRSRESEEINFRRVVREFLSDSLGERKKCNEIKTFVI